MSNTEYVRPPIQVVCVPGQVFDPKRRKMRMALFTPEGVAIDPTGGAPVAPSSGGLLAAAHYNCASSIGIGPGQAYPIPLGNAYLVGGGPAWAEGTPSDHWTRVDDETGQIVATEDCVLELDASALIAGSAGQRIIYTQVFRAGAWQLQQNLIDYRTAVSAELFGGTNLGAGRVRFSGKLKLLATEKFRVMIGQANGGGVVSADISSVTVARIA